MPPLPRTGGSWWRPVGKDIEYAGEGLKQEECFKFLLNNPLELYEGPPSRIQLVRVATRTSESKNIRNFNLG